MTKRGSSNERGYNYKWQKARRLWLLNNPLCRYCDEAGYVVRATVVDHIEPHRGNDELFWDQTNWQSLCKSCHDGAKQSEEKKGYSTAVDENGWPIDDNHPVNERDKKAKKNRGGVKKL